MIKKSMAVIGAFCLIFLLNGCGNNNVKTSLQDEQIEKQSQQVYSGKEGRITAYISGPEQMLKDIETEFEKEHGDVLEVLAMGCGPLAQKVNTEAEAGNIQADIIWGAEPLVYIELKNKGLLQQYYSPEAKELKAEHQIGDGYFTLCNSRYGVIVYNREKVDEAEIPTSWNDLTKVEWKNRIAIADAGQSAMALALVAGLVQMDDGNWDYIQALKDNDAILTQQNNQAIERVAAGEADVAIVPHDGVLRSINKDKKAGVESSLAITWSTEGAFLVQRPIAIIANEVRPSTNNKLCQDFIDFVLSSTGQQISAKYGFISVRNGQGTPAGIPQDIKTVTINWEDTVANTQELRNNFDKIMTSK